MNWDNILQFILNLIGQGSSPTPNPVPNPAPAPVQSTIKMISIQRGPLEPNAGIFGQGSLTWDSFTFVSLENEKLYIPAGTYKLEWHESDHLGGATVPLLVDVPGRTEILIHWGNTESCSEGCILCGTVRDGNAIDTTQTACKELFAKINEIGIENCQIEIN